MHKPQLTHALHRAAMAITIVTVQPRSLLCARDAASERRGPRPHPHHGAACQSQNSTVEARRRRATDAETWTIVIRIFEKLDFAIFVQLVTRRRLEPVA